MANTKERNRVTVLVACLIVMTTAGILNSTSVFVSPLAGYFGWSTDAIANVSTLMLLCWTPGCLLGGSIMNRIGARSSILLGGILFSLGLLCTSFVPKSTPGLLYLTFSLMQGVGNGITYTVATYVATGWFPDRRGLAAGLCMACNGGASAFLAPICAKLTLATSIITTLRTVGIAAMAVVIVCGVFIASAPVGYVPKGFGRKGAGAEAQLESYNVRRAVRTRPLWHLIACTAFFPTMYMIMFPRFSVLMQDAGFSLSAATLGVSIYFIANTLGRLLLGALCDRISYKHVYGICGVFCILSAVFLIFADSVSMFYIGYICLGIGFGATNSVYPVAINKSYGPVYAGGIYGISLFGYMLYCTLITPRISVALVSATGDYTASFIYAGALTCIAVLSMYLIPRVERKTIAEAEKSAAEGD